VYRIIIVLAITLGLGTLGVLENPSLTLRSAGAEESSTPGDAKAVALKAYQRGTAHYQHAEYDKAIEQFESGYQAVPQAVFLYNIAQSHRMAGRADRALGFYRYYLQMSPEAKNRAEIEDRITVLEKQVGPAPTLIVPSVGQDGAEPAPTGLLSPDDEKRLAALAKSKRRRRNAGIALGVIGGVLVVGAAVGLGLYFGLPKPPEVTVFQPVTP